VLHTNIPLMRWDRMNVSVVGHALRCGLETSVTSLAVLGVPTNLLLLRRNYCRKRAFTGTDLGLLRLVRLRGLLFPDARRLEHPSHWKSTLP